VPEMVNNLLANLKKQIELYKKLMEYELKKQESLVENNIQEIETITAQEEKILLEVSRLEDERLHWAEFFGQEIGKEAKEITLADLASSFPVLEEVRQELDQVITKLQDLHQVNSELLKNAVNLVNFTIESLTGERKITYTNPADNNERNKHREKKINIIDKSI
jgi:flagellar biosynthesis/type III secretory pathway chaperone